jgi:hypothetical protein
VVTLGFTIGVLVAGPIYADAAREAILSSAVSTAPVTVKNVRFLTYGNPSYDYETANATLEDEVSRLPVGRIVPQGRGTVRLVGADPNAPLSLTVLFRDGATDRDDPFWFGDQTPFPPPDSTELSPGLMDRAGYLKVMPALGVTSEYARPGAR